MPCPIGTSRNCWPSAVSRWTRSNLVHAPRCDLRKCIWERTVNPSADAFQGSNLDPPRSRNGPWPAPIRAGVDLCHIRRCLVVSGYLRLSSPYSRPSAEPRRQLVRSRVCCDLGTRPSSEDWAAGRPCIRLIGQLVRPALRQLQQRAKGIGLTRRNALVASQGFSVLADVQRPGDGPGVDLACGHFLGWASSVVILRRGCCLPGRGGGSQGTWSRVASRPSGW
jgi:hypothetical protein